MDIQKYVNYRILAIALFAAFTNLAFANDNDALDLLKESYQNYDTDTSLLIEKLQESLKSCDSQQLKERIKYRIGILYFKKGDISHAQEQFSPLIESESSSIEIKIAAVNMTAQIARIQGHDSIALKYFDSLIEILNEKNSISDESFPKSKIYEMYTSSIWGKADVYKYQKEYETAINVYIDAIQFLKEGSFEDSLNLIPAMYDDLSQLYLKMNKADEYYKITSIITNEYPSYSRSVLIGLESFAVQYLKEKGVELDYSSGSINAPSKLILYVKEKKDTQDATNIEATLKQLSEQPDNNFSDILIKYHYAWFLDSIGRYEDSYNKFSEIISDSQHFVVEQDYLTKAIIAYSKIQKSIMDGEQEQYREGLKCLESIDVEMKQSQSSQVLIGPVRPGSFDQEIKKTHIGLLLDSVHNSLQTLQREVPKNENTNQ